MLLSLEKGITCRTKELVQRISPMLRQCDQVYILADSSKFEKDFPYQITPLRQDFIYITDNGLPEDLKAKYAANHLKFIYT